MTRPRSIDRDKLLSVAEDIVSASSPGALSFGGIAKAAGLSKATVQSVFGTREALIEALLMRWMQQERIRFDRLAGPAPSQRDRILAHLKTTAAESAASNSRIAALMAALAGSGQQLDTVLDWYAQRAGDLKARSSEERRLRMVFLAAEGAFFVRHLAGVPMSQAVWQDVFKDLLAFESGEL